MAFRARSSFLAAFAFVSSLGAASACGLDVTGTLDVTGGGDDAATHVDTGTAIDAGNGGTDGSSQVDDGVPPIDSGSDVPTPIDAPPTCSADAGCIVVPNGWTLIAIDETQGAPCPTGFAQNAANDVVSGPNVGANACACGACTVPTPPTCNAGPVSVFYDFTGPQNCSSAGVPAQNSNNPAGACGTDMYKMSIGGFNLKYVPPPASGGTCSAPGTQQKQNVTFNAKARLCQPDNAAAAGCNGNQCKPTLPSPYKACVVGAGNQICPAGFPTAHHVGSDVSYACGACPCSINATCTGTMTLYSDTQCQNNARAMQADGACRGVPGGAGAYQSYKYTGNAPTGVSCTPGAAPAPANVVLTNQLTVCCSP